jgi:hypothetical protein
MRIPKRRQAPGQLSQATVDRVDVIAECWLDQTEKAAEPPDRLAGFMDAFVPVGYFGQRALGLRAFALGLRSQYLIERLRWRRGRLR